MHLTRLDAARLRSFFFAPPGGESLADVCLRVDRVINLLHRECADQRVILVRAGRAEGAKRPARRCAQQRLQAERWSVASARASSPLQLPARPPTCPSLCKACRTRPPLRAAAARAPTMFRCATAR